MIGRAKVEKDIAETLKTLRPERELYTSQVVQIYHDYEELVYNLSDHTNNETIRSIKAMSVGERMKLQQLITRKNQKQIASARTEL